MQRAYRIEAIDRLRAEHLRSCASQERVRRIDDIENTINQLDTGREYPVDSVVKQMGCGGWVPRDRNKAPGTDLIHDLRLLIEDISDSVDQRADSLGEQVLTVDELAKQFNVTPKTIARWREAGLVSRKLVFDGRKRVGFLRSSVDRFVRANRQRVDRGAKFSQLSDRERHALVAEARVLAAEGLDLTEVTKRLTERTGRTADTVRATLRQAQDGKFGEPLFPSDSTGMNPLQRQQLLDDYRGGVSVEKLALRYSRSKTTVYRLLTEARCEAVSEMPLEFISNDRFKRRGADEACLGPMPEADKPPRKGRRPADLPAYLASLYEVPLLTREQEAHLFRRYNYLKYKASKLRESLDTSKPKSTTLDEIERLNELAVATKNQIAKSNLRLVVSIAKKRMSPTQSFFELVSDGNVSLMKAIEKFDFARGNKFSTYATWALVKNFARTIPNEYKHRDRFRTSSDELFESTHEFRDNPRLHESAQKEREKNIQKILRRLDPREQQIVISRFGLDYSREPLTLKEVGAEIGVTKERVRQIEARALDKLRQAAAEEHVKIDI